MIFIPSSAPIVVRRRREEEKKRREEEKKEEKKYNYSESRDIDSESRDIDEELTDCEAELIVNGIKIIPCIAGVALSIASFISSRVDYSQGIHSVASIAKAFVAPFLFIPSSVATIGIGACLIGTLAKAVGLKRKKANKHKKARLTEEKEEQKPI